MARMRHHPPHGMVRAAGPPSGRLAHAFGERGRATVVRSTLRPTGGSGHPFSMSLTITRVPERR